MTVICIVLSFATYVADGKLQSSSAGQLELPWACNIITLLLLHAKLHNTAQHEDHASHMCSLVLDHWAADKVPCYAAAWCLLPAFCWLQMVWQVF